MIRNIFLLVLSALATWSCTAPDDEIAQGPATGTPPADAQHSLCITVAPKPAFTEAAITMPDGKNTTNTRALQTEKGTKWEQGDVVWLRVLFRDETVGYMILYYSALKYTGTTWRYLTEIEADDFGLNGYRFNRTLIYDAPNGVKYDWADITAFYTGSSKPDANGLITIPAPDSGSSVPMMTAHGTVSVGLSQPLTLSFTYLCSRLRIPAGYSLQMTNYRYYESYKLTNTAPNIKIVNSSLDIPATDRDRDIFLLPVSDGNGTPAPVTLTRSGGATWTFTPRPGTATSATDYYGQSYTLPALGNGGVTPGGM